MKRELVVILVAFILIAYPVSAVENSYKFTGKPLDQESGLYYYGARYYNPDIGRFTTPDILKGNLRNPSSLNRYTYVTNNPLKFVDPTGNQEEGIQGGAATYDELSQNLFEEEKKEKKEPSDIPDGKLLENKKSSLIKGGEALLTVYAFVQDTKEGPGNYIPLLDEHPKSGKFKFINVGPDKSTKQHFGGSLALAFALSTHNRETGVSNPEIKAVGTVLAAGILKETLDGQREGFNCCGSGSDMVANVKGAVLGATASFVADKLSDLIF